MPLSPFDNPVPTEYMQKIQDYARDLAWGITQEYWDRMLEKDEQRIPRPRPKNEHSQEIDKFFKKWFPEDNLNKAPNANELLFWQFIDETNHPQKLRIRREAFDLLIYPIKAPNVFISYRRTTSSTLALAIEARLRLVGHHNVFVDKDIDAGQNWFKVLEQKITECDYFVLLVDNDVFASQWMIDEYKLARSLNKMIVPIIHPEVVIENLGRGLNDIQVIDCRGKASAASYEDAINRLLNRLGYSTY